MTFISRGWQTIQMYVTELQITFVSDFVLWILTAKRDDDDDDHYDDDY